MVATDVMVELQVTRLPKLLVLPSLKAPIAENPRLVPFAIDGEVGRTLIEVRLDRSTVKDVLPVTDGPVGGNIAVMVAVPIPLPIAKPLLVVMKAILPAEELHVETFVMSCVVPSEKVPVAVNCC